MKLSELKPPKGAVHKRKRVGRGDGSGHGGTSGKGAKGQNARSGGGVSPSFEGGQMPLTRRLPKRGFHNNFSKDVVTVNVGDLNRFPQGSVVDMAALMSNGLIKKRGDILKILGNGTIDYPLTLKVHALSKSAREKIEASGGTIEVI
ncbi:MAG: 50S ribosomal protein L15 [Deltaproteobacteria bacterium]|nr:50S ribosomal protein L15 [Deltaproteobacteria bacterium]